MKRDWWSIILERHRGIESLLVCCRSNRRRWRTSQSCSNSSPKLWELKWKIEAKIFRIWNELTRTDRIWINVMALLIVEALSGSQITCSDLKVSHTRIDYGNFLSCVVHFPSQTRLNSKCIISWKEDHLQESLGKVIGLPGRIRIVSGTVADIVSFVDKCWLITSVGEISSDLYRASQCDIKKS